MRRVGGDAVFEHERRLGERPSLDRVEFLDRGGHAAEGQRHIRGSGRGAGSFGVNMRERVQIRRLNGRERRLYFLNGGPIAGAERLDQ